jgi:predicted nucleotidyltransferase component of viral defense system
MSTQKQIWHLRRKLRDERAKFRTTSAKLTDARQIIAWQGESVRLIRESLNHLENHSVFARIWARLTK